VGAIVLVAAAAGVFAWLLVKDDDGDATKRGPSGVGPVEVSAAELSERAGSLATPVYWASEVGRRKLEFTLTGSGRVFVRYLTSDAQIGERRPDFLTVATYPASNAYGALRAMSRKGAAAARLDRGGLLVGDKGSTSAHFSYPGAGYQVEVFAPRPGRARRLVLDGRVQPVR
jgi:hypothetical protein